jgi:hypothetical protein
MAYPNPENALVIIAHGGPKTLNKWNAQQLAAYIKANTQWKQGDPIILNACKTGQGADSIAEQLSTILGGNTVVAPDQAVWNIGLWDLGPYEAKSTDPSSPLYNKPDWSKPGSWRCFGACVVKK